MIFPAVHALSVLAMFGPVPLLAAPPSPEPPVRPIRFVETQAPAVAITFDACATKTHGYGFDRAVYDLVRSERLPVTIFVSGRWVEMHADVMEELAREPLVEFGDHSYDHPHMTKLDRAQIGEEIDRTEAALAVYGKRSVAFRPPFGSWSRRVLHVVQEKQLPTVTWDVVSGDPSVRTTAARMVKVVVGKSRPGSIIIFHINGRGHKTAEALPEILRGLRGRGFQFVSLSELLASAGGAPLLLPAMTIVAEPGLVPAALPVSETVEVEPPPLEMLGGSRLPFDPLVPVLTPAPFPAPGLMP